MLSVFLRIGGYGDRDVDREGRRRLCLLSFNFFYAVLFLVPVPRFSWLWRRLRSLWSYPTDTVALASVVPIFGASSSSD